MQFVHRIRTIWSWLPSFRAVGETEHLPSAAAQLGIVPSSLSRTVKQLEDELGIPLFDRTSKTLILNESGRVMLAAVREAMRIVDDAVAIAIGDEVRGNVAAIAPSDIAQTLLVSASDLLSTKSPGLSVTIVSDAEDGFGALVRGEADAAVGFDPGTLPSDLRSSELATWTRSIYSRADRPDSTGVDRCVVVGTPSRHADDGWPEDRPRVVAVWAPDERTALELCARSDLMTVAFDAVARSRSLDQLVRHAAPVPPRTLFLVHRKAIGRHRRTEVLVEAIQAAASL